MSARSATATTRLAAPTGDRSGRLERDLLARLGLSGDANSVDIQNAHDELIAFLENAPRDLGHWARRQIDIADEAYALLSDPTTSLADLATWPTPDADSLPPDTLLAERSEPAGTLAARSGPSSAAGVDRLPISTPARRVGPVGRALVAGLAIVAIVTVGYAVYASGTPAVPGVTGTPAPEASGQAQLDSARVAALMAKIQADPKDVASLQALGDMYFGAGDYTTAADWESKVLALEPANTTAMLGLGAAQFNQGDASAAERQWRAVLALDPKNLEAHYDLGFMYFSQDPPDVSQATEEWNAVIEIAPDSDIAKTVSTHLKTLETWAASPAASASPATSAGGSGSAAPAGSPAPSAGTTPGASTAAP
jgi:cytochrome c-type biogenesis protein CcmH/NrfG